MPCRHYASTHKSVRMIIFEQVDHVTVISFPCTYRMHLYSEGRMEYKPCILLSADVNSPLKIIHIYTCIFLYPFKPVFNNSSGYRYIALTLNLSKYNSLHISNPVKNAFYVDQIFSKIKHH